MAGKIAAFIIYFQAFRQECSGGHFLFVNKKYGCWMVLERMEENPGLSTTCVHFNSLIAESTCPASPLNVESFYSVDTEWVQSVWKRDLLKISFYCSSH